MITTFRIFSLSLKIGTKDFQVCLERFAERGTSKIFCKHLMFYQIFLLSQVKRGLIIINKYGIHELPHELAKEFNLRILTN